MTTVAEQSLAERVFLDRYALRDESGQLIEHEMAEMHERVARAATKNDPDFYQPLLDELTSFRLLPAGRLLATLGSPFQTTPYNCFVLPSPPDSREGIMHALGQWVEIQSRGGGVGINMSSLRPRGARVRGVNGTSSGPVNWMELFSTATVKVIQQGGSRRGAAMLMLDDSHPDIEEFIQAKKTPGVLEGANISVAISNAFMDAVGRGGDWPLRWQGEIIRTVKAQELWQQIISSAWSSGEPGVVFMERINEMSNSWYFEQINCCNPCSEQPLGPYSVCLLSSLNINEFMFPDGRVDYTQLARTAAVCVRFLDNIIDDAYYPLPEQREAQLGIRRMGIGTAGIAGAMIVGEVRFGSEESVQFVADVYRAIRDATYRASVKLAEERGPFPKFKDSYLAGRFIQTLPQDIKNDLAEHGIRNCFLTTQAPTGSSAKIADVWPGLEPYFSKETHIRNRLGSSVVVAPDSPFLVTANDVTPEQHIAVLAAAQKYVDSSISKTVNAPHDQTVEETAKVYDLAWRSGVKSVAYYRDGSRDVQVQYHSDPSANGHAPTNQPQRHRLSATRQAVNHRFQVGEQEGYISVGLFPDGSPGELFLNVSQQGSTVRGLTDGIGILVSLARQYGVPLEAITRKFRGMQFEPAGRTQEERIPFSTSVLDYLGRWLEQEFGDGSVAVPARNGNGCPECGSQLIYQEGCQHCSSCGYTRC